jgi:hypothetical protein
MSAEEVEKWGGRAKIPGVIFEGPDDVRNAFIGSKGIDWTASYIDSATWIGSSRTLITATGVAFDRIMQGASKLREHLGITVREGGERIKMRQAQEAYEQSLNMQRRPFSNRDAAE